MTRRTTFLTAAWILAALAAPALPAAAEEGKEAPAKTEAAPEAPAKTEAAPKVEPKEGAEGPKAEAPVKADPEATIAEAGDLKVPAKTVWQIEKAQLDRAKASNPDLQVTEMERRKLRREIALNELRMKLLVQYVASNKLPVPEAKLKERMQNLHAQLDARKIDFKVFLENIGKTEAELNEINSSLLAIEEKLAGEITEEAIKKEWETRSPEIELRRCSHILLMYKGSQAGEATRTKEEAKAMCEDALKKLKEGADFAKLAGEISECPSKAQGGDLEFSAQKQAFDPQSGRPMNKVMVPTFTEALYKLEKKGDLSGIVETPFGYHIIKLTEVQAFDDYKERLKQVMAGDKMDEFIQDLQRKNNAIIRVNEPLVEATPPAASAK
ncbi:MAG: peptidylprolyl isomerase [Planctomycetes bacterium]|nr:peptidylprolyl isomerase [Planctomycetota bacterium]